MQSIKFQKGKLFYLDQSKLPAQELWRSCLTLDSGYQAIKKLRVRGAPLIGVFAAYCICIHLKGLSLQKDTFFRQFNSACNYLRGCRPTAVNLAWALDRLEMVAAESRHLSLSRIKRVIVAEAKLIHRQDRLTCKKIAEFGSKLIKKNENILTHCNTGFLATAGCGTALGIIYEANSEGKNLTVYVDETRPLLQGSRLTAWELSKKRLKHKLISDNSAAFLMQKKKIDSVFVGADRITAFGNTANKIGTYNLAVLARQHKLPFYVAAPTSTFDLSLAKKEDIAIEERPDLEVKKVLNKVLVAPEKTTCLNYAFDITPPSFISGFITDQGIIYPPYQKNIKAFLGSRK